ncbi:MAG: YidC/Oxa1 family membrane protein insertase [Ktedonobacteraceae bacterium]
MGELGYLFNLIFTFPILNGLMLLDGLFHDFGLSIIVLTLIIKLILFPLTLQQLKSMKATQALQPQMAEIKKKYAKDQQAQALATQALYKEYGVNPVAGCLPLLVQLPVLYGLFNAFNTVLRYTGKDPLQHINSIIYPFLPHFTQVPNIDLNWFTFLNPSWHFALSQPDPTHVLPILAGLATFVQLRMSQPKTMGTTTANDPTQQSMKTMQYIMPLVTVFFGWTFAAGLALYWTVSSIFQAVQQYFVTGWGGLITKPNLVSKSATPTSQRDFTKEKPALFNTNRLVGSKEQARLANNVNGEIVEGSIEESDGPIGSQLRSNGSSAARRRPASARRRSSNNIQKRNVSRR